jgi:hypothetical protein
MGVVLIDSVLFDSKVTDKFELYIILKSVKKCVDLHYSFSYWVHENKN